MSGGALGDGDLTPEQLEGMDQWHVDVMLSHRHRAVGAFLVHRAVAEIRRHRAATAAIPPDTAALIAQLRNPGHHACCECLDYTPPERPCRYCAGMEVNTVRMRNAANAIERLTAATAADQSVSALQRQRERSRQALAAALGLDPKSREATLAIDHLVAIVAEWIKATAADKERVRQAVLAALWEADEMRNPDMETIATRCADQLATPAVRLSADDAKELSERRALDALRREQLEELASRRMADLGAEDLAAAERFVAWAVDDLESADDPQWDEHQAGAAVVRRLIGGAR